MNDEKTYSPIVVDEVPFPTHTEVAQDTTGQSGSENNFSQKEMQPARIPRKIVAQETIGSALNTKSRKILAEFTFTELGAIAIGRYQNGISGDIRITPAGFVARNTSGDITVSVDGETGNAVFAGELRSGTLITGDIVVGNNTWVISGDPDYPRIVLYNNEIPEIVIGEV